MHTEAPSAAKPAKIKKEPKPITGPSARPNQVAAFFEIDRSTLYRWIAERHDFPKPRKVGPRTTIFLVAELIAFRDKSLGGKA